MKWQSVFFASDLCFEFRKAGSVETIQIWNNLKKHNYVLDIKTFILSLLEIDELIYASFNVILYRIMSIGKCKY